MSKKLQIHPLIKKPLSFFLLLMVLAITVIAVSDSYVKHAYDGRQSENRAMRIWKNKIDGSRESNKIIDQYETHYLNLVKNHIIGEENRLNWLETIQTTANAKGLLSVKFNVGSQRLMEDKQGQHSAQGLKIYHSDMTLDMKMAHEADLFSMLNTLQEKAQGLFTVNKCIIENVVKATESSSINMHAYCDLSWYTFKSAETVEKKSK